MTVFCFLMLFTKSETSRKEKNGEMRLMFLRRLHVLSRFNVAVNNSLLVINFHRRVAAALQARKCLQRGVLRGVSHLFVSVRQRMFLGYWYRSWRKKKRKERALERVILAESELCARTRATRRRRVSFSCFSFFPPPLVFSRLVSFDGVDYVLALFAAQCVRKGSDSRRSREPSVLLASFSALPHTGAARECLWRVLS